MQWNKLLVDVWEEGMPEKAKRAAALPENMKPVKPGGKKGGDALSPWGEKDLPRINEAVLTVLETIGLADAIPSCIEACTAIG
ncbi:MAG: hypothetical protein CM1200mP30_31220 [Pseudomonadota bacterium]|nr:MAG: hypothetical protein CM1200mP30_31220 [Pseudomonadota bacterium]